jgi:hypothetical protein
MLESVAKIDSPDGLYRSAKMMGVDDETASELRAKAEIAMRTELMQSGVTG